MRALKVSLLITCIFVLLNTGCQERDNIINTNEGSSDNDGIKIGFSMGTLQEERWQRDRDIFVARAQELGAEVIVLNAYNDNEEQIKQTGYLIEQGIDILVIIPHDAEKSAEMVHMAKKAGIKVISYDRLIKNAGTDLYISFDNVGVGELMASQLVKAVPTGNYVILKGAPTDNNSTMFYEGYMNILNDYVKSGDIKIVAEIWAKDWAREDAFQCVEETLEKGIEINGIIAGNDGLAAAAIEALSENRLAGKVAVVGHDADLSACQRVVEGTQLMTVYKPIEKIAKAAAEAAIKMAGGQELMVLDRINDGKYDVPYLMIEPIPVTIENMQSTIIKDSFHRMEDIYINIPKYRWPKE
ncbi:MAG: sugar ABC transporter substrate-binding protein [Clostridiaceae bacterium]|nr:sugar ABC transporter substrate-binding protein [Clostridiaceae bacterium]